MAPAFRLAKYTAIFITTRSDVRMIGQLMYFLSCPCNLILFLFIIPTCCNSRRLLFASGSTLCDAHKFTNTIISSFAGLQKRKYLYFPSKKQKPPRSEERRVG